MNNLVHGIAVVIGFILWQVTGNIIIAAISAVIAESIILVISIGVAKHKAALAAAIAEGRIPPKRLWWRIAIIAMCGASLVVGLIPVIFIAQPEPAHGLERPSGYTSGYTGELLIILPLLALLMFGIVSLVKAIRYNKLLTTKSDIMEK
jgi:hypothetical protein